MNALVTVQQDFSSPLPGSEPVPTSAEGAGPHTIFTPRAQGEFLKSLQLGGNVRLACRAARVSSQTAYRARRRSPALARAWDAALLAARAHAEATLAERALEGVEEAVFYHGEEVARRRRYDSRLLLAHLARLDRMAERPEVQAALALLDAQIEGLEAGVELRDPAPDPAPAREPSREHSQDRAPPAPSCRICGGYCDIPGAELGPRDCEWYPNRVARMEAARPHDADRPEELARETRGNAAAIEAVQLEAFEADVEEWWLVTDARELEASMLRGEGEGSGAPCPDTSFDNAHLGASR